ncbi:MAG: GntR family transcriptional regulator, partial [Caulobacteraceae bacterium]
MAGSVVELREASKSERVYAHLRRRIRELALEPGAPLRKDEIARALTVSRAPVSEAIARLADEGLVEVFPQHGSFVAPIRPADVREALFVRTALETEAMRRLAPVAGPDLMTRLDANLAAQADALAGGDLARFYDLDEALHALIFGAAQGPRPLKLLDA